MIEEEEGLIDDHLPTTSRGLWAASETERALKTILVFGKAHRFDILLIEEGNYFMELLEAWKKEYKVYQSIGVPNISNKLALFHIFINGNNQK